MYWEKPGKSNTDRTLELALQRALERGIKHVVVASCSGATADKLVGKGVQLICVTHHVGFAGSGNDEMGEKMRRHLQNQGVKVLTTTHLLAGVDRACRIKFGGVYPAEIMAQTLRMLGQGVKVATEAAVMALDAGLIPHGQEVIAVGGTVEGADAAIVVLPAHSNMVFDTEIREIICMPRRKKPEGA